jgi:hypothetical protein
VAADTVKNCYVGKSASGDRIACPHHHPGLFTAPIQATRVVRTDANLAPCQR